MNELLRDFWHVILAGTTVLFSGIPAGTVMPIRAKRIRSTSTTATLLVCLI